MCSVTTLTYCFSTDRREVLLLEIGCVYDFYVDIALNNIMFKAFM